MGSRSPSRADCTQWRRSHPARPIPHSGSDCIYHTVDPIASSTADRNVDCIIITSIITIDCVTFDSRNNLATSYFTHPVESIAYSTGDRNVDCIIITLIVMIDRATFDSGHNLPTTYFYCHRSWAHLPTSILSISVGSWVQVPDQKIISLASNRFNSQRRHSGKRAVIGGFNSQPQHNRSRVQLPVASGGFNSQPQHYQARVQLRLPAFETLIAVSIPSDYKFREVGRGLSSQRLQVWEGWRRVQLQRQHLPPIEKLVSQFEKVGQSQRQLKISLPFSKMSGGRGGGINGRGGRGRGGCGGRGRGRG
jgi:hypothetical protein